ncbi:MAG TPA: pyridoxamine 5'-phosphate oxidase family protein [Reyranella sp.]
MSAGIVTTSFPVSERNKVRRLHERGSYDKEAVYAILDADMICHIAYTIDGQPYCTPTAFWREGDHLYWHGSSASRMLRTQRPGVPVRQVVDDAQVCPGMPAGVERPEGLSGFTPGRRLDEVMTENYERTYGEVGGK